ncbi:class I SAM-dependent DNA methyltransferase [Jiella mangrovi]|uniref:site-specific DNA-methyltransferase (adenine-specific) n=1 Tax=Jiella mangrovi TaxID=2821407 RepID=A0ABS4BME4_9HYPH|nr:class I SAM-dependent DNA methyltransferase [Jiella mangrovi]MBP0617677.1 class I SAM-dependent DNA methyltransferase [Jiella mangrovi]
MADIEAFIERWTAREGGAERANYQMFLTELCDVLEVPRPEPAGAERGFNDYVFERAVRPRESEETAAPKRIDLYKKGCFILEAKQSRLPGQKNAIPGQLSMLGEEPDQLGRRTAAKGWDVMMQNARRQAESYVFLLDASHPAPPFLITCDVGNALEIFADFTGTGRAYGQFPDRKGFRIYLEELRKPEIRQRLATIWTDPKSLDPARESARVTREIARRLAEVSKALEAGHPAEDVAHFLMRCIFTMFAEDVDLIPKGKFTELLADCVESPGSFVPLLEELWAKMDEPVRDRRFYSAFRTHLRHFNGNLFKDARAFPLGREEIGELLAAAKAKWTEVDPAIFGTLLEQALEKTERKRLGAHYTPRAYVQRLVEVTVMEPLREDWRRALTRAQAAKEEGEEKKAAEIVRGFLHQLCETRVLDPACGTGNFLYVSLELMKRLEGEVLETLARLGAMESLGLERETVDPHQFLGLELNPRAAAIAELVVWIGYLQQHYRTRDGHPAEPILKAFRNINFGRHEGYDAVLTWDGYPLPTIEERDGKRVETYPNPRRPDWPEAEFIVGNPPFIGGKDLRSRLGSLYAEALWAAHKPVKMNESADFVMYWWDRAADMLTRKKTRLKRFGFVTTNSITQVFQRRVMEKHLNAKAPASLVYAIPDHPWTKATKDSAAVRIAMTVAEAGKRDGVLLETLSEKGLDTDEPEIVFARREGSVNSDLSVGVDLSSLTKLDANKGLSSRGVVLHGKGFIVTATQANLLGKEDTPDINRVVRPYRNGRDLTGRSRGVFAIDLFELTDQEVRTRYPAVYQHVVEHVKPERDLNPREYRRKNWWLFGENVPDARDAWAGLQRFIATVETAKHRVFQFLEGSVLPDNKLLIIASSEASQLAMLSSRVHAHWALTAGGWIGYGNDPVYVKSRCFDPFPFPDPSEALREKLRAAGEELDATRKRVLAEHDDLTLTGLYNVLEKLKSGEALSDKDEDVKRRGLVLILKELHETIDALTAEAYGWPADLSDEDILERLVALNAERAKEEAAGHVRWLRPDYQIPRFAKGKAAKSGELALEDQVVAIDAGKPAFPSERTEQPLAVDAVLIASGRPMGPEEIARAFKRGGKRIEPRVAQALSVLARYGHVTALPDGRFAARRAA